MKIVFHRFAVLAALSFAFASHAATPIATAQEFIDQVFADPAGDYILSADIAFTKQAAVPEFSGTLDGDGHKITGLSSNLVTTLTGTIKGLTIDGVTYQHKRISYASATPFGFFSATVDGGSVTNCRLTNCTVTQDKYSSATVGMGGIVGNIGASGGCISSCKVMGCSIGSVFTSGDITYGGIVGRSAADNEGTAIVSDCQVISDTGAETTIKGRLVGGIVGGVSVNKFIRIERCLFNASIVGGSNIGGILGPCNGNNSDTSILDIVNCTNMTDITANCAAGGIVAGSFKGGRFRISGCVNKGNLSTSVTGVPLTAADGTGTGGIMGGIYAQSSVAGVVIDGCANYGAISESCNTNFTGGLVGFLHKGSNFTVLIIRNSVNHANVTSGYYAGGLVGYATFAAGGSILVNCAQTGNVTGTGIRPAGGLIGRVTGGSKLSYRFSNVCQLGTVSGSEGAASPMFGELSVGDKSWFKVYLDSVQIGGSATSTSGTTGIIGGSATVTTSAGALTVTVDSSSAFAENTGTAYYDQTGAAKELALSKLASTAMTDKTAVATLNAYAATKGLVSWVQMDAYPELSIFGTPAKQRGLIIFVR